MKRILSLMALGLAVMATYNLTSCGTIVHGTTQEVPISSNPSNAEVIVKRIGEADPVFTGKTPCKAKLDRKYEYEVWVKVEGYKENKIVLRKSMSGAFLGNILCGGIIGIVVDISNGAMNNLEPGTINVTLKTASLNGVQQLYTVVHAMDSEGQLRELTVPMIVE